MAEGSAEKAYTVPLPGGQRATLITAPLTDEGWETLLRVLSLYRPALTAPPTQQVPNA